MRRRSMPWEGVLSDPWNLRRGGASKSPPGTFRAKKRCPLKGLEVHKVS